MATHHRTKGVVLKKMDKAEADRIFDIFTEDFGKMEVRGKAIRKINSKLKSGIDLFCLSEIEFIEGKNYKTLTDAIIIDKFYNIPYDLKKARAALRITEVLDEFIRGHGKDQDIFNLLNETLIKINNLPKGKNLDLAYYYFIWNFLANQGYSPQLFECVLCKSKLNPYGVYFSCKEGGALCRYCQGCDSGARKINSDIVKILRIILKKDWDFLSRIKVEQQSLQLLEDISAEAVLSFSPVNA